MIRTILAATTLVALTTGGAFAQGETTATQTLTQHRDQDDSSARLPLAGKADPADLLKNTDGSQGSSKSTTLLDSNEPAVRQQSNDDTDQRVNTN